MKKATVCVGPQGSGKTMFINSKAQGHVARITPDQLSSPFGANYTGCDTLIIQEAHKDQWTDRSIKNLKEILEEESITVENFRTNPTIEETPFLIFIEMQHALPEFILEDPERFKIRNF